MIYYFSGTGNTRFAADTLAATTDCGPAVAITAREAATLRPADGEPLGFCFPIHGWMPPRIMREFIAGLSISGSHYCFAVVTCGDSTGRAIDLLKADLAAVGLHLSSAYSLIMPESYVCLPFFYTDPPEREARKIAQSRQRLASIAEALLRREEGVYRLDRGYAPWLYTHVFGRYFNSKMITDRPFAVDASRCTRCGLCRKVCPTANISLTEEGTPQWAHADKCTCCLACYHHCPVHAINYGRYTRRRGQYYFRPQK